MSFLKEFSYSDVEQRKIVHYNLFFSACIIGLILGDLSLSFQYYFFYSPVTKIIVIFSTSGFFFGNLAGRFLFNRIKNQRVLFILFEIIFLLLAAVYSVRSFFITAERNPLLDTFFISPYIFVAFLVIASFIIGIRYNFFLKLSCGDFIDEKQGIIGIIVLSLLGFSLGSLFAGIAFLHQIIAYGFIIVPLLAAPSVFFIKLHYDPAPQFAREFEREYSTETVKSNYKDTLIFTYLNFALIVLLLFLGLLTVVKFYGNQSVVSLLFFSIELVFMSGGLIAGKYIKKGNWHIYGEMLFPPFFLLFVFMLYIFNEYFSIMAAFICFAPVSVLFGFTLRHTIKNILENNNHRIRFNILEYSLFILPIPIILSLQLINFTNFWYFIVIYTLTFISIFVPGLHLLARNIKGYRKALYFLLSMLCIPLLIFIHVYFGIPMDSNIYIRNVENFNVLKQVNYNALFIKQRAVVRIFATPVFRVSDSVIRNLKRSLVPLALYVDDTKPVLFIDGNQKFFKNPVIGLYKNAECLDILSDENVDFNNLPLSGKQTYVTGNEDLLFYLRDIIRKNNKFSAVVDVTNLADQQKNLFRYSEEYYRIVRKSMTPDGLFVQLYALNDCRGDLFNLSVSNLKKNFKSHAVYLFSDQCVILSSNNEKAFEINTEKYAHLTGFLKNVNGMESLFLNEMHLLSHLVFTKIDDIVPYLQKHFMERKEMFSPSVLPMLSKNLNLDVLDNDSEILKCIAQSPDQYTLRNTIVNAIAANKTAIDYLKRLEYAESIDDYDNETKYLFELQKYMAYRIELRDYVSQIFSYKEKYYYNTALRFEKEKKWEDAKKLYNVVLSINSNNFDANYRLGLLYLTLQDIGESFKYFGNALRLQSDHPKVLYEMGVLYFLNNKTNEAISYFDKALEQKEANPSLFRYLGQCYEKLGNDQKAEEFYTKALFGDQNDLESKARLNAIKKKKDDEQKKWESTGQKTDYEAEQGVELPLPINKSAYDIRLKDDSSEVTDKAAKDAKDFKGETK